MTNNSPESSKKYDVIPAKTVIEITNEGYEEYYYVTDDDLDPEIRKARKKFALKFQKKIDHTYDPYESQDTIEN